ncbi:MAG TPA: DUF3572 family protein [Aurantimonas sp.]|uniref:DUF3572 domain-containing protein n=1 Tax=Aurantimonas marianensis TaxID=2920428 RepID=A0A9X2HCN5_9HYPH|nr:DUF3572 family protein [Aurantimonas marianensis]MCP3054524.1 DUF3572 domain-containing protein [Aurantimonas marianensis]
MNRQDAEALAVAALAFIAADPTMFDRFLALTGLEVYALRQAAATPGFLPGVLDFILAHEPTLLAFAADAGADPSRVAAARRALGDSPFPDQP